MKKRSSRRQRSSAGASTRERHLLREIEERKRIEAALREDLRTAAEIQDSVLPDFPPLRYVQSAIIYQPYGQVSGDVYDFLLSREGELGVFLGDATGHGVSAALLTMMIHLGLDTLRPDLVTDEIMRRLNRLIAGRGTGRSVTGVMFRLNAAGRLTVTHAGHPSIFVAPGDGGEPREFGKGGCALGSFGEEPVAYEEEEIQLRRGDRICACTDGAVDWRNADGEVFGMDGLREFLREARAGTVQDLAAQLQRRLATHAGGAPCRDDLTILLFEYSGAA